MNIKEGDNEMKKYTDDFVACGEWLEFPMWKRVLCQKALAKAEGEA